MNVVIFNTYQAPPHFLGLSLEYIQNYINLGHKVFYVTCNGAFDLCGFNTYKLKYMCDICKQSGKKGLDLIEGDFQLVNLRDFIQGSDKQKAEEFVKSKNEISLTTTFEEFDLGSSVYSSLISKTREREFNTEREQKVLQELAENAIQVYLGLQKFIQNNKIDKIILFNGRWDYYRAAMSASLKSNIKIEVFEHFRTGGYYQIFGNNLPHNIENYNKLVEDHWENEEDIQLKSKIAGDFYAEKRSGISTYDKVYTKNQQSKMLPDNLDVTKSTYVLFNSSDDEFAAIGKEWSIPLFKDQLEGILFLIEYFKNNINIQLVIRVHPNLKGLNRDYLEPIYKLKNKYNNIFIVKPEDSVDTYELIRISEKVITFGSTTTLEANMLDKPVILLGNAFFSRNNVAYMPSSRDEIINFLEEKLVPKPKLGALKYAYYFKTGGIKANYFHNESPSNGYFKNIPLHETSITEKVKLRLLKLFKIKNS